MQGVGKQINSRVVREENLGDEIIKMIMISVNICCGFFSMGRHPQSILHAMSHLSFITILKGKAIIFPYYRWKNAMIRKVKEVVQGHPHRKWRGNPDREVCGAYTLVDM